jgi:hypothetical protein
LYLRPAEDGSGDLAMLDATVQTLVVRHSPRVALRVIDPAAAPDEFAALAPYAPAVFLLRRAQVVGEAMGASLPIRELDRIVRCAIEWTR